MSKNLPTLFLASALCLLASQRAHAELLPDGFPFRRPLNFKQINSDAPGENLAWATFYTNGQHKPDGSDFRVTSADRLLVPSKVLQVSPDNDFVRIAFNTRSDGPYYVWWGNPNAQKPEKEADIQRGILVDVFKLPAGAIDNKSHLDKVLAKAKSPVASTFVNSIFLGHNPLGAEWNALLRYTGQFKVEKPLVAQLAFTVNDTGYVAIDGKLIADEYRAGFAGDVRNPKRLELTPGWHKIEVVQANQGGGNTGVVVAWKRPADKNFEPIPGVLFAQAAIATDGPLEKPGSPYVADFTITPAAESFIPPNDYLPRYTFEAAFPATFKPTAFTWDFGDGQTATGPLKKINHLYLLPGNYTVKLKLEQAGKTFETSTRITVFERLYERFPTPPEDRPSTAIAVLKEYNTSKLNSEQALRGLLLLKRNSENDTYVAWGKAFAAAKDAPAERGPRVEGNLFDEIYDLSRLMQLRKEYQDSAEIFKLAAAKPVPMETSLNLLRYYVITLCDFLDDPATAQKETQAWQKLINETNPRQSHLLNLAAAYAALARGDEKAAKKAISDAGNKRNLPYNEQQIRQGVLARNIENYIRTKENDTALKLINDWESEYPDALWEGFTRTLRVKLYAADGQNLAAARVAVQHAKANPNGFYAAELLYRASQLYKKANEETQSKAALDLLKSKYPESPYARDDVKEN